MSQLLPIVTFWYFWSPFDGGHVFTPEKVKKKNTQKGHGEEPGPLKKNGWKLEDVIISFWNGTVPFLGMHSYIFRECIPKKL